MAAEEKRGKISADPVAVATCGLIMPISGTPGHDKPHWEAMLELLKRAAQQAGHDAKPVWIESSTDRVSERIIGNIFEYPVVIAYITDLNPNVMFELGMRLASKKPTLVVMEESGAIPFDIRDFHIHIYPQHLSILGMEKFINGLAEDIIAKFSAFQKDAYAPFLSKVVVDVVAPNEREVSMNQFMLDQLSELNRRIANLDRPSRKLPRQPDEDPNDLIVSSVGSDRAVFYVSSSVDKFDSLRIIADDTFDEVIELGGDDKRVYLALVKAGRQGDEKIKQLKSSIDLLAKQFDLTKYVPRYFADRYSS